LRLAYHQFIGNTSQLNTSFELNDFSNADRASLQLILLKRKEDIEVVVKQDPKYERNRHSHIILWRWI